MNEHKSLGALARDLGLHAISAVPCCVILGIILVMLIGSCTLDTERLRRERADIEELCLAPLTLPLQRYCERVAPDIKAPTRLLEPE